VHKITPHLAVATVLAAGHLGYVHPLGTARVVAKAAGGLGLAVVVLILALLLAIARATRSLAALASEFLRLAAELTSAFFIMVIVVVLAVVLLVHH